MSAARLGLWSVALFDAVVAAFLLVILFSMLLMGEDLKAEWLDHLYAASAGIGALVVLGAAGSLLTARSQPSRTALTLQWGTVVCLLLMSGLTLLDMGRPRDGGGVGSFLTLLLLGSFLCLTGVAVLCAFYVRRVQRTIGA